MTVTSKTMTLWCVRLRHSLLVIKHTEQVGEGATDPNQTFSVLPLQGWLIPAVPSHVPCLSLDLSAICFQARFVKSLKRKVFKKTVTILTLPIPEKVLQDVHVVWCTIVCTYRAFSVVTGIKVVHWKSLAIWFMHLSITLKVRNEMAYLSK